MFQQRAVLEQAQGPARQSSLRASARASSSERSHMTGYMFLRMSKMHVFVLKFQKR